MLIKSAHTISTVNSLRLSVDVANELYVDIQFDSIVSFFVQHVYNLFTTCLQLVDFYRLNNIGIRESDTMQWQVIKQRDTIVL